MTLKRILCIAAIFLLADEIVLAQAEFLPGSTLPEQVSRALKQEQPKATQSVSAPITPPPMEASPAAEQAKKIKFQLNGIILSGNRVYSTAELSQIYRSKLHKVITVADLFDIVQAITNYYRNNGYIISRALLPPQHVKGGVVRVQIIEGFIDQVEVTGKPYFARCAVLMFGNKIRECPPLQISRMEYYLLLANEIPATDVKSVLSPSKKVTGAADLSLVTENKPVTAYLSYDNYGTRYIGPQQMTANIAVNSFITSGDMTQLTATKTPKGTELTFFDLNTNQLITEDGARLILGATRTTTHPLFVLEPAKVNGINDNYYANFLYPVIRTRTESLTISTNFNYLDSNVNTFNFLLYADHVRPLGIGVTYNFADSYYGSNLIYGDIRQGLPILGYTSNTDPQTAFTSRPGGRGDFTKIDINMSRLQAIMGPFSAYAVVKGQWAFNPLLASEQFAFGGSQLGRGYDVAELIGDKGIAGTIELRADAPFAGTFMQSMQFYTFYDWGEVWNFKNLGAAPTKLSGTSTGFGSRFFFAKYISGNIMWTQTLTKQVAAMELIGRGKRPRVFFSVVMAVP